MYNTQQGWSTTSLVYEFKEVLYYKLNCHTFYAVQGFVISTFF